MTVFLSATCLLIGLIIGAFGVTCVSRRKYGRDIPEGISAEAVLESLDMALVVMGLDGCITYVNQEARRLCIKNAAEVIGKSLTDVIRFGNPSTYDHFKDFVWDIVESPNHPAGGKPIALELNGSTVFFNESRYPILNDIQEPVGLALLLRRLPESSLAERDESSYRKAFEASGTAMVIFKDDMTITTVNAEFENLTQYSRDEIEGKKSWPEFIARDDLDQMTTYLFDRHRHPNHSPDQCEFRLKDKNDHIKHILNKINTISDCGLNVGTLIDISAGKHAEENLRQSEKRYRSLVESTMDGYFMADMSDGRLLTANAMFCELLGYSMQETPALTLWNVLAPEITDFFREEMKTRLESDEPLKTHSIVQMVRKDGTRLHIEISQSIATYHGAPVLQGLLKDVTERNHLQRQLQESQKMNAIGTLAGGIAHDFNNLLMGIQGYTTLMLLDVNPTHPHYSRLKSIEQHVEKGANLTRQILDFAQTKKQQTEIVDLNLLIKKNLRLFSRTRKEINIHTTYQHNIYPVKVDSGQIEQVLLNLYLNACQAMPGGGDLYLQTRNIRFSVRESRPNGIQPGDYVKISVRDTGVGIPDNIQAKIFEPFFSTKPLGKGTGMGLASSYGIIRTHGGMIEVNSKAGEGAVFDVYLPTSNTRLPIEPSGNDGNRRTPLKTILLVDDERLIIDVGFQLLKKLGYQVLTAEGGSQAEEVYKNLGNSIDLVILDVIMPGMGGRETYKRMKSINPDVKVLLSSGYCRNRLIEELIEMGCNGFVQKPFTLKELENRINAILSIPPEPATH